MSPSKVAETITAMYMAEAESNEDAFDMYWEQLEAQYGDDTSVVCYEYETNYLR